ncbi:LysM peptidoglycan-binding domain-containing protein [Rothia dentocariosa]|uniref:LysM peptidoglycan-binding domain-containing protein n=1 Tax=Rothia dentocariosa TaxID=2047 RepID=UPI00065F843F|nr:LysM peptidoglycan-binding domain-containing protein [Rothia dentocariosa]
MKSQAQMSVLDGVLSIGVPTLSVLSGVLAHSVRVISVSLTGLENAMMISVEVLSAAVMLWWALGVILGVGYLLKVRAGSIRLHHREDRGTFLLPRYIRNTILTLGGAALGLSAAFAPAQAADAHPNISTPAISAPSQLSASPAAHSASSSSEASVENSTPSTAADASPRESAAGTPQGVPSQNSPFYQAAASSPQATGASASPHESSESPAVPVQQQRPSLSPYAQPYGTPPPNISAEPAVTPTIQPQAEHQSLSPFFGGQREGAPSREVSPASRNHATRSSHQVVVGDSLWSIASHELSDDASPPEILEYSLRIHSANLDVMGDNPNILYPGQTLTLPDR